MNRYIIIIIVLLLLTLFYQLFNNKKCKVCHCRNHKDYIKSKYFNKIFVVNLDARTDKMKHVKTQLDNIRIAYQRFSAIAPDENICQNTNLTRGVVGCSLSHRALWNKLLQDNDTDWYLIFEDDIYIPKEVTHKSFDGTMDIVLALAPEAELVAFGHCGCNGKENDAYNQNGNSIVDGYIYCTHAYAISKKGAKRLLQEDKTCLAPIDNYIGEVYSSIPEKIYRVLSNIRNNEHVGEGIVFQDRKYVSDIQDRTLEGLHKCIT